MPKICIIYDEQVYGENEGAYDVDTGELIHSWSCNDATWRGEYLEPIFEHFGFEFVNDVDGYFENKFREYLRETYYIDDEDDDA